MMFSVLLRNFQGILTVLILAGSLSAQEKVPVKAYAPISMEPFSDSRGHWYGIRDAGNIVNPVPNQPKYPESDIIHIADNILLFQRNNGGWPKNYDMQAIMTSAQVDSLMKTKDMVHTTFDNSTTYTHVEYLARVYAQTSIEKYKDACLKGIRFMLLAQYPNGGWPQYFPLEKHNYSSHITFNDGAYLGVLMMLKKIADNDPLFSFVGTKERNEVKIAYSKGLECILKSQIVSKGRLTAWCQQYDEVTLKPAWARAYEMPGISNGESAQVVLFLMSLDDPDKRTIESIQSAIKWFGESKIYNTRVKTIQAPPEKTPYKINTIDRVVVVDSTAPPIWTRFYEIETEKPLFSDRNSKLLYSMAEVGRERRSGYGWYTYAPQSVLDKYPAWQKKWAPDKNVLEKNCPNLTVSANKRFLTADGKPFFWLGDTGWMLPEKLNRTETEKYLEVRKSQGFNVIQIMLLHTLSAMTVEGDSALVNKNVATPKVTSSYAGGSTAEVKGYWENLDFVVDLAAQKGIYVALVPVWGPIVRAGQVTEKQAGVYAGFLALRYKNKSNIIWVNGGDVRGDDSTRIWKTIGRTLKKEDPNHLITYHPFGRTQSSAWFHNEPWLDFNMFQSGHRSYEQDTARMDLRYGEDNWRYVASDYKRTPVKPTLDGEPSYEGMPHGLHDTLQPRWTDSDLRRYAYWSVFSGACGFTYGNNSVMQMRKKSDRTSSYGAKETWNQAINNPGARQMIYLRNLMKQYHFEAMVPDQSVLADPGERYNHLTALAGKDYVLIYTWNGRVIAVKPELLTGNQYSVNWFSPKNGMFMNVGQIKKGEKFEFNPPGEIGNGNDWVLILIKYAATSVLTIPRDSSFTTNLTWLKLKRDFPQAKIVEEKLPEGLIVNHDITYKTLPVSPYGRRDLHLDVFRPQKEGKYPVLLLIHGGGWRSGNRTMEHQMAQQVASHGYVAATVEYRLSEEAIYPAAVYDIKAAVRFLRSQAKKFSLDPNRIAISGTSAGGQLAALVGMTGEIDKFDGEAVNPGVSEKIQSIIDIDGVLDFRDPNESAKDDDPLKPSAGAYWFGATLKQAPEKWTEASPIVYAGKNSPPILFINSALPRFHAGRDSVITILNRHGIYNEVHTIENTPHPFWLFHPWFEPTVGYMVAFLDKILKKER